MRNGREYASCAGVMAHADTSWYLVPDVAVWDVGARERWWRSVRCASIRTPSAPARRAV
jgi:hypothetical protein